MIQKVNRRFKTFWRTSCHRLLVASASRDDTLRLWDGQLVASASEDNTLRLWDAGTGSCRSTLEGHRKKTTFYSAIFWVDATTVDSTKGSFWAISEEIKRPADVLHDIKARVNFVLREHSSWSIRWLLVFDNYDNLDAFPNITDFIPQNDLGPILVTSRHADSDTLVLDQSNHFIKLHGLEEDAAIFLLTQRSQTKILNLRTQKRL